ncbi:MAG: hypothetical protein RBS39_00585 [Phycisphaerales bacterium]|jgi:hypothetical protein|nr:hypothetical protein [Phycisphaerales bacterium]
MDEQNGRGYAVQTDPSSRWIEAGFSQNVRLERSLAALHEAIELAGSASPRRFLLDMTHVGTDDSHGQMLVFAQRAHETGLRLTDRVAVIVSPSSTAHDFAEQAMQDRGYQYYRAFRSRECAVKWLLGE